MPKIELVCKREGCDNTFTTFPSSNKKYCDPSCRYSDPSIAQLLNSSIKNRHNLSDIDEENRTAQCSVCGVVDIRQRTEKKKYSGRIGWRCRGAERARIWAKEYSKSPEDIKNLLNIQDNSCAICGIKFESFNFYVDHSHTSGAVRGLLCMGCNTGIGLFQENIDSLQKAIEYLNTHNT